MPTLKMLPLTVCLLTLALASAAAAGPVYRWTTADGSVAYADDLKKIPSQYRASAKRVRSGKLGGYARYTPGESRAASHERSLALRDRIERLRDLNEGRSAAGAPTAQAAAPAGQTSSILRLDDRTSLTIPHERFAREEPVVVEERRVRDRNNISTTHVTVVRQGDEILSVVRPESAHDRADWGSEQALLGEGD